MDWKERLRVQCDLSSQANVAKKLGVSTTLVAECLAGRHKAKTTKLQALVLEKFPEIPEVDNDFDWQGQVKHYCNLYSIPAIAKILGVSNSVLHIICRGAYNPKRSKLKTLVLVKLNNLEEKVQEIDLRIPVKISRFDKAVLGVVDAIFCADIISYQELRESFDKHVLSRTLNYLIARNLISVLRTEKEFFKHGRPGDNRIFKLACNCSSPGIGENCGSCPLGQEIARIEGGYLEDLADAC